MYSRPFYLLIAIALLIAGCDACEDADGFTVNEESGEVVVDGGPGLIDLPVNVFPDIPLQFNLEQELEEHDASGAKAVFLRDLRLQITDGARGEGDEDNFDFLEKVTLYVASRKTDSDLKKVEVARLRDIPSGQEELVFEVDSDVDLKPYIEEGIRLTSTGQGSVPEDDVSLKALAEFFVEVI